MLGSILVSGLRGLDVEVGNEKNTDTSNYKLAYIVTHQYKSDKIQEPQLYDIQQLCNFWNKSSNRNLNLQPEMCFMQKTTNSHCCKNGL